MHTLPVASGSLYQRAIALNPGDPLPHIARLSRPEETNPERF